MRVNRSLLGWGTFFILLGAIPLAVQAGVLTVEQVDDWWRFWPLILVGIGLGLLLRRTALEALGGLVVAATFGIMLGAALSSGIGGIPGGVCGPLDDAMPFAARDGVIATSSATVEIGLDCGDVTIDTTAGGTWMVSGADATGDGPEIDSDASSLSVQTSDDDHGPFGWTGSRERWAITLPTGPRLGFDAQVNAGSATVDLADADIADAEMQFNAASATVDLGTARAVSDLDIQLNAGSLALTLPATGTTGTIEGNAASVDLCAPPGVALRLRTDDSVLSSFDYDGHGLVHTGDTWQSPDFDAAAVRIDLLTRGNAASFTLDPEEGCGG
jgi:hypothetical protein